MNEFKNFKELSDDTLSKVLSFGVTSKTVIKYFKSCVKKLNIVMNDNDIVFSKSLALTWLKRCNYNSYQKISVIEELYYYFLITMMVF